MLYINILIMLISFLITWITVPIFYSFLLESHCTELNYKKEKIPIGMGILFLFIQIFILFLYSLLFANDIKLVLPYSFCILLIGFAGFIDDVIGDKNIKGFKGHIRSLLRGRLTSGGLKAISGIIAAVVFSIIFFNSLFDILLNSLIIVLFTNFINLFDLRPGRSSKMFILSALILILAKNLDRYDYFIFSIIGIVIAYLPFDIKGKTMMGDTGSNILGITLGIYCVVTQVFLFKIGYLTLLIVLHLIAESCSFTNFISKNKVLKYLDDLGR